MGKRGPAPKPKHLKLIEGTYRRDREAPNAPDPVPVIPSRPSWLGEGVPWGREAVREWSRIVPHLESCRLLTQLDRANLAAYCDAVGRWWHYRREVERVGPVQVTDSGYRAQNPEVGMMNRALEDMAKFGAKFGLSPSDRTRVSAEAPNSSDADPWAKYRSG